MIKKNILEESTEVSLALPAGGFAKKVLEALSDLCSQYESLSGSYLALKKVDDDVSLFFGFKFDEGEGELLVGPLMKEISALFSDDLCLEGADLDKNNALTEAMQSVSAPFYTRK